MDFFSENLAIFFGLMILTYISWRKTELGIYIIIFFLPAYLLKLNIYGIPSTALELGVYILFSIWLIRNYGNIRLAEIVPDKILRIGIFLLLSGALISTVFSTEVRTSAGILKGWFIDPLLFFVIIVSEIKTLAQKENILKALLLSGLGVAILSLLYWFGFLPNGVTFDNRLQAFYLSPNYLAMYLSPALIIGIGFFILRLLSLRGILSERSEIKDDEGISPLCVYKTGLLRRSLRSLLAMTDIYFWLMFIFLISIVIYFTYSYAAWIAIVASLLIFLCMVIPRKKRKLLIGSALMFFILLLFSQIGTSKFENLKNLSYRSSYNSRIMIWRAVLEIGKDHPIIGIGPGNFQKYYLDYQTKFSEPYLEWAVPQPHNIFLAFWLETGIIGLFGFIVIVAWFLKRCLFFIKANLSQTHAQLLVFVLLSLMIYIMSHGLFDTTYWKNDLAIVFWLNLALLVKLDPI